MRLRRSIHLRTSSARSPKVLLYCAVRSRGTPRAAASRTRPQSAEGPWPFLTAAAGTGLGTQRTRNLSSRPRDPRLAKSGPCFSICCCNCCLSVSACVHVFSIPCFGTFRVRLQHPGTAAGTHPLFALISTTAHQLGRWVLATSLRGRQLWHRSSNGCTPNETPAPSPSRKHVSRWNAP